jgi:hypothetical protein
MQVLASAGADCRFSPTSTGHTTPWGVPPTTDVAGGRIHLDLDDVERRRRT